MFLWQKYKYNVRFIEKDEEFIDIANKIIEDKVEVVAFDIESTGLHIKLGIPFLVGFGFHNHIYVYEPSEWRNNYLFKMIDVPNMKYFVGHNTKFDYHMFRNGGTPVPKGRFVKLADTMSMARLTSYVDDLNSMALSSLAGRLFDPSATFGEKAIKTHFNTLRGERRKKIREYVLENRKDIGYNYTDFTKLFNERVQHIPAEPNLEKHFKYVEENFPETNYEDIYKDKPLLMINYLFDDIVMTLQVYNKLSPVLDHVDVGRRTFHRECELIRVVGDMEAEGIKMDIDYFLKSREKVIEYTDAVYEELWEKADIKNFIENINVNEFTGGLPQDVKLLQNNPKFSVGQHGVIKALFAEKFKIGMHSTDMPALKEISNAKDYPKEAKEIAELIVELRSLNKVLSTYINGKLNSLVDGKLYTDINNSGTVTGRVSSDLQQQPSHAIFKRNGEELFHPRKPFINDEGYTNYFIDFSNMELRVQAYYTMIHSDGDLNMCRAFIPFKYTNILTGELYDPKKDIVNYDNGTWINENGEMWQPLDLHTVTTLQAFPNITVEDKNFRDFRELGKRANFLINYGGGLGALEEQLEVTKDVAKMLNNGYYAAYPNIYSYRNWVDKSIKNYGFVENLLGRRYYFRTNQFAYRGYNYLIQGSCADYLKEKQIELNNLLSGLDSKMLLPIHDEMIVKIKHGEDEILKDIVNVMQDSSKVIPLIPMLVEVNKGTTNWADAEKVII